MAPIVDGLETQYRGMLTFERKDAATREGEDLLRRYGLRGHPSYAIVAASGEVLWTATGQKSAQELQVEIAALLGQ